MNVRNKKVILLTILSSMGVGMLTLSISQLTPKAAQESLKPVNQLPTVSLDETDSEGGASKDPTIASLPESPTIVPKQKSEEGTSKPIYEFESKPYPEIDTLIQNYYLAKASGDIERLKELLSDPSYAPNEDRIKSENSYIEDYGNITNYIKKSYEEGSYIVYVYHEVKFFNIGTPAPYLDKFYVITDPSGEVKIYSPEYKEELAVYYAARDQDVDVQQLIKKTNKNIEKAINEDEQLRIYLEQLSIYLSNTKDSTQAEGDAAR